MIGILVRLVVLLSFLIFFGWVLGGFYLDAVVKKGLERIGPQITGTPVSVERVNLSLVLGRGRVQGLVVKNPKGYHTASAYYLPSARITFDPTTVIQGKIIIDRMVLEDLEITYEINLSGNNLDKIKKNVLAFSRKHGSARDGTDQRESGEGLKYVQINHFIVKDPKLNVSASIFRGRSMTFDMDEIHLRDIGKSSRGATMDGATSQILASTVRAVQQVVSKSGKALTENARRVDGAEKRKNMRRGGDERAAQGLKKATDLLSNAFRSVKDALGNVFKKEKTSPTK